MSAKLTNKTKPELKLEEITTLVEMFSELMNAYGTFAGNLGTIHKTNEEAYNHVFSFESMGRLPEILDEMGEKAPPELNKLFIQIFSKMTSYLPMINKIMDLSADQKIKLGKNLKSLAKDFEKLSAWINKSEK